MPDSDARQFVDVVLELPTQVDRHFVDVGVLVSVVQHDEAALAQSPVAVTAVDGQRTAGRVRPGAAVGRRRRQR